MIHIYIVLDLCKAYDRHKAGQPNISLNTNWGIYKWRPFFLSKQKPYSQIILHHKDVHTHNHTFYHTHPHTQIAYITHTYILLLSRTKTHHHTPIQHTHTHSHTHNNAGTYFRRSDGGTYTCTAFNTLGNAHAESKKKKKYFH